ncbi:LysR family transcriptional regulator [Variovorax sp. W6]|uniref:LysR family transcriptional regulator n=1 Tax=Variovorax sp. W6 TaxID=3093895 RepID=UPI003D802619
MITSGNHPARITAQQLRDFIAVLGCGGFRAAARSLSVSQAGLTKSVARLEEQCGFALVARTNRGIEPTVRGEAFLPYAKAALGELERAEQWISDAGKAPVRHVALGVSIEPSLILAPSVLADFRLSSPGVTVHVSQCSPMELVARLRDNRIELAVTRVPDPEAMEGIRAEPLYEASAVVVARVGHPKVDAHSVRELADVPWVVVGDPSRPSVDDLSIRELFVEQRLGMPQVAAVCDSLFGAISMVMTSDCVARLPRSILGHPLASGVLVEIPVREKATHLIALLRRSDRRLGKEARLLSSMLKSFSRARSSFAPE